MTKTVFISRNLDEDSEFATLLQAAGWQVRGLSLVTLTPLPIGAIPEADWIFFASKNAVRFFFEAGSASRNPTPDPSPTGRGDVEGALDRTVAHSTVCSTSPLPVGEGSGVGLKRVENHLKILKLMAMGVGGGVCWAALGPATARALLRYTHRVDFTGTGDPATTAEAFKPLAPGKKVLFPAARHSQRSVPALLGDAITALHLAVYDNGPVADPPALDETVLVFTSPMNARAYFARHSLKTHQKVVAIGRSTGAELAVLGVTGALISEEPTESALAAIVMTLGQ